MRDLLLLLIVVPGGFIALRHPFVGAMLWAWLSIMNPHRLTWGFMNDAPVALFVAVCTLIGLLATRERRSPFVGSPTVWLLVLILWMCVTTAFAFEREDSLVVLEKVLKIDVMVLVTLMLMRTKREMMVFVWVITCSVAFYGVKGGIFTILTGGAYRVWGPSGTYIEENNALAVALIMTVPLLRFLQMTLEGRWKKTLMTGAMVLCGISVLGSHSRGALLAISAMLLFLWLRGKNKLMSGVFMAAIAVLALSMMPEHWWDRMGTIQSYEEDRSAMGRINAWQMAYNVAKANFFGGGFSLYSAWVYQLYAPDPSFIVSAHSIYFHMLGEHGFGGLFLYLILWASTWFSAAWLRTNGSLAPETMWCAHLGAMVQVSLVGFLVGGAFLSLTYFDLPYNLMAVTAAAHYWVRSGLWKSETPFKPNGHFWRIPLFFGDRIEGAAERGAIVAARAPETQDVRPAISQVARTGPGAPTQTRGVAMK